MEKKTPVPLMGRLAIHHQMITMEQLTEAVRVRGRPGEERNLGDVLLDLGFITQKQLQALVVAQRKLIAKQRETQAAAPTPVQEPGPGAARTSSTAAEACFLASSCLAITWRCAVTSAASCFCVMKPRSSRTSPSFRSSPGQPRTRTASVSCSIVIISRWIAMRPIRGTGVFFSMTCVSADRPASLMPRAHVFGRL